MRKGAGTSGLRSMAALLRRSRTIVLTTHTGPDGDGFGSELALARVLRTLGRDAVIVNGDRHPDDLAFLVRPEDPLRVYDPEEDARRVRDADAVVLLDVSTYSRLGRMERPVRRARGTVACIDHHHLGESRFDVAYVRTDAAATAQCVYDLLRTMRVKLTREIAEPLYAAVVTDTGSFRFSMTSPETHRLAAELLRAGVNPSRLHEELYERNSPARLRLLAAILGSLEIDCGGRLAWFSLRAEMLTRCGATLDDSSEMVNYAVSMAGVEMGILFKELGPATTKASVRSRGEVDANEFARSFGGGGHTRAAGIVVHLPFEEGKRAVLEAARGYFRSLDEARESGMIPAPAPSRTRGRRTG